MHCCVAYQSTTGAAATARVEIDRGSGHVTVWATEPGADGAAGREYDDTPDGFGRIAATTARQVILQRLRDAEDELTFGEYAGREGDIVAGVIQQGKDPRAVLVDLGKIEAILPPTEQVPGERYAHGERLRCYVLHVRKGYRGPSITLSRTHPNLVKKLFALEVPEIASGAVDIKAIAREAGHRTKIAVSSHQPGVNAKGACIGPMGSRVRNVMTELHGEKIDIVDFSDDPPSSWPTRCPRPGCCGSTSSIRRPGWPRSSCRTTSCRWRSAKRGRTRAWRPGSPDGRSTSSRTTRVTRGAGRPAPAAREQAAPEPVTQEPAASEPAVAESAASPEPAVAESAASPEPGAAEPARTAPGPADGDADGPGRGEPGGAAGQETSAERARPELGAVSPTRRRGKLARQWPDGPWGRCGPHPRFAPV